MNLESTSTPPQTPFSRRTQLKIRNICRNRCVVCLRRLGDVGQCAHILDSSDTIGATMVSYAISVGILAPKYSRSAVENGVVLCSSCHQDFFTRELVTFSPPRELLQYLVDYVENSNNHTTPIHKLFLPEALHSDLANLASVLPFLDLYTLVALDRKRLENIDFGIHHQGSVLQLLNGCWITVPPDTTPNPSTIARIYDPTVLLPTDRGLYSPLDLSTTTQPEKRFWRLPTRFTTILSVFLHRVAYIATSEYEEIKLGIKLRSLLTLRTVEKSSSPAGSAPSRPGGDLGGGRKLAVKLEKQVSGRDRRGLSCLQKAGSNKGADCQLKPIPSACLVKRNRHPVCMPRMVLPRFRGAIARLLHVIV